MNKKSALLQILTGLEEEGALQLDQALWKNQRKVRDRVLVRMECRVTTTTGGELQEVCDRVYLDYGKGANESGT